MDAIDQNVNLSIREGPSSVSNREKTPYQVAGFPLMGARGAAMDAEGTAWSPPPLNHNASGLSCGRRGPGQALALRAAGRWALKALAPGLLEHQTQGDAVGRNVHRSKHDESLSNHLAPVRVPVHALTITKGWGGCNGH